jgi:hypothetical protein
MVLPESGILGLVVKAQGVGGGREEFQVQDCMYKTAPLGFVG